MNYNTRILPSARKAAAANDSLRVSLADCLKAPVVSAMLAVACANRLAKVRKTFGQFEAYKALIRAV